MGRKSKTFKLTEEQDAQCEDALRKYMEDHPRSTRGDALAAIVGSYAPGGRPACDLDAGELVRRFGEGIRALSGNVEAAIRLSEDAHVEQMARLDGELAEARDELDAERKRASEAERIVDVLQRAVISQKCLITRLRDEFSMAGALADLCEARGDGDCPILHCVERAEEHVRRSEEAGRDGRALP